MPVLEALRARIQEYETSQIVLHTALPFGIAEIDSILPDKGLKLGVLHEVAGDAAATLFAASILARMPGPVLWCIRQHDLFAPALAQAGLAMERVIFVEAGNEQTVLDCFEEGLRHGGLAGVVAEIGKCPMSASRRLQLAAENSGTMGIALRCWQKASKSTVAHTSWRVSGLPSVSLPAHAIGHARWRLELLRCQGAEPAEFDVKACDENGGLELYEHTEEINAARRCG